MRKIAVLLSLTGCASIPLPVDAPQPEPAGGTVEIDACVIYGERAERRMYEGVSELSFEPWHQAIAMVVLKHPSGVAVVDPAFGYEIADDLKYVPPWFRIISGTAKGKEPAADGLLAAGIEPRDVREALLTHAHWDHAGALRDLPRAVVVLAKAEAEWVEPMQGNHLNGGVMPQHFRRGRLKPFEFDGPPLLRFDASHDVFQDGSVIAVPLPGHTPGSTGYLVRGHGGKRWLLTGDSTWTVRGVEKPAHKMVRMIDQDGVKAGETIGRLNALMREHPEIAIVPAHDASALELLPTCASSATGAP